MDSFLLRAHQTHSFPVPILLLRCITEAKLAKIKGEKQTNSSGKDLLSALSGVKSDAMHRLTASHEDNPHHEAPAASVDPSGVYARVVRKVCPQKQALNTDESKVLIKHDELTANKIEHSSPESDDKHKMSSDS